MFGTFGAILLIVSLVIGGSGVTVAAAQNSQPDQALYPIKTWSEDARVLLTNNQQTRLELALEFSKRRAEEKQVMLQAGLTPPETVQTRMQSTVDLALQLAAGQPDNAAARSFEQIQQQLRNNEQTLSNLGPQPDPRAEALLEHTRTMLRDRLQLCAERAQDPDAVHLQLRNRDRDHTGETSDPGSGFGPGPDEENGGNNPWTTGTPTPGSGYGPGPGDGEGGNNPWTTGTPTPGSGYGPGPGDGGCGNCNGGDDGCGGGDGNGGGGDGDGNGAGGDGGGGGDSNGGGGDGGNGGTGGAGGSRP